MQPIRSFTSPLDAAFCCADQWKKDPDGKYVVLKPVEVKNEYEGVTTEEKLRFIGALKWTDDHIKWKDENTFSITT